jgi:uncharacterized membrane protein YgcG
MNTNLKVIASAVALATVVTAPAVAKSHTRQHAAPALYGAPALAYSNYSNYTVFQPQGNRVLGTDPDPRIRFEILRDGNSSWESMGGGGGGGGFGGGGGGMGGR